jgi:Beta-lactamase class C and other penicillin binding proteins
MKRRDFTRLLLASPFLASAFRALAAGPADSFRARLETIRARHDLPGMAALALLGGKIVEHEAVGVRKIGSSTPIAKTDRFHIGSCTKSMTATLAAMMVEEGKLRWDTTVAEALPQLKIHPDYRAVTLDQLLRHRGGLPEHAPAELWSRAWKREGTPMTQRARFVASLLAAPPAHAPGSRHVYSNQGYAVAGHMLETVANRPWEELMRTRLFGPLGMSSAGFGVPDRLGQVAEPWGHTRKGGRMTPVQQDNPPAIGPGATVHCSLGDLATYARLHLDAGRTEKLLRPESFRHLHTPHSGEEYACGWISVERGWARGRALTHAGSNTYWYVVMWLAPKRNFAAIAATNVGDADQACDEAIASLISRWL